MQYSTQLKSSQCSRRQFVATNLAVGTSLVAASTKSLAAEQITHSTLPRELLKTLKIGMLKQGDTLEEKFAIALDAGFDGVELNCPGSNIEEVQAASKATGLVVDGSVCGTHWNIRHTSPETDVRAQALADLKAAIEETHAVGGHTVLLVVGRGSDGPEEEIWGRSIENISKALPLCAKLGVRIAIENVWNQFLYEHGGSENQSADKFARYVDEFNSPWVGMQFDIGNHWKYGNVGDWIRTLGHRIVKLDIKGFSRSSDKFTDITEGDLPWPDTRLALDEIGFEGWVAAEVGGGDAERLAKVSRQIDLALNLKARS